MLFFSRKDSTLEVTVQFFVPGLGLRNFKLTDARNHETEAQLIVNSLKDHMHEQLKKIAEEEYKRGWADAKAKRKRSTWFRSWWPN